jgi:3-oxoacyl-[acyl-carrier protein] reductase
MTLELSLAGRIALVTGASRGIGRAAAIALGRAGARVMVAAGTARDLAESTASAVRAAGAESSVVVGDLSDPRTPEQYVEACRRAFGGLDILVNNAGIWEEGAIGDVTPEAVERTLAVNLKAALLLCRHAAPLLAGSAAGRIVNVSSTASLLGEPLHAAYAASKGGLDAMTRSLAVELGPSGITVNAVAPGWTATDMVSGELESEAGRALVTSIPLRKIATADDVALAIVFLASDWAGHVNGVVLPVEGGYRIRR